MNDKVRHYSRYYCRIFFTYVAADGEHDLETGFEFICAFNQRLLYASGQVYPYIPKMFASCRCEYEIITDDVPYSLVSTLYHKEHCSNMEFLHKRIIRNIIFTLITQIYGQS